MQPPSAPDTVVEARGPAKRYRGGQPAVDGLDPAVPRGSVFGFLGPNGSGRTTTIRMLFGLIEPSGGSARLLGEPMPDAARRVLPRVGALIEGPAPYGFLLAVTTSCGWTRPIRPPIPAPVRPGWKRHWNGWGSRPPPARGHGRTRWAEAAPRSGGGAWARFAGRDVTV